MCRCPARSQLTPCRIEKPHSQNEQPIRVNPLAKATLTKSLDDCRGFRVQLLHMLVAIGPWTRRRRRIPRFQKTLNLKTLPAEMVQFTKHDLFAVDVRRLVRPL